MTMESAAIRSTESRAPDGAAPLVPTSGALRRLAAAVLIFLWAYAVYRLGKLWHSNQQYTYGWIVPLLCLWLFWRRWLRRPAREPLEGSTGPLILWSVLALTLLPSCLFLEVMPNWRFAGWAFAAAIIGISFCALYLIGGRSWVHHFAFPLLFFLVAVPWPARLEAPLLDKLSHLNAALSAWAANWLGTPAVRHGAVIQTGAGMAGLDAACSAIRSFQGAMMVALFLGELFRCAFFRRVLLLLSGVALVLAGNVVRTTHLVRVCDLKGESAIDPAHDPAGFTILGITGAVLLLLAWLLRRRRHPGVGQTRAAASCENHSLGGESGRAGPDRSGPALPSPRMGMGLAVALVGSVVWILAIEVGIEVWFRPMENRLAAKTSWSLQLPASQPEFRESPIQESVRVTLKCDEGKQAEWREASGRTWQVYYLRWHRPRTRYRAVQVAEHARRPATDVCLKRPGMALQQESDSRLRQVNGIALRASVAKFSDQGRSLHVLSCCWQPNASTVADPRAGPAGTARAMRAAWQAIRAHDRGCTERRVLKLAVWGLETDEEAEAAFSALLGQAVQP